MMTDEDIVREITTNRDWSESTARVYLRAKFRCEYCDLNFLESPVNFKQIEVDHIVPRSAGGTESEENLAAVCRTCNVRWKSRWNPRKQVTSQVATRADLVSACREYVRERPKKTSEEIARILRILGAAQPEGVAPDGASPRR